jgi:hypothetical protein
VKQIIGQSRNGARVFVQLIGSQAGKQIARQPQLMSLAKEMLAEITLLEQEISIEYDMQRPIGYCYIIETTDKDIIIYGHLIKDEIYTRFVKNGKPLHTRHLTLTLSKAGVNHYELCDIWIGKLVPPRPGSEDETAKSKPYWSNHALIFDNQPLQQQTVTKICPY